MTTTKAVDDQQAVLETVRAGYAAIAEGARQSCCGPSSSCGGDTADNAAMLAQAVGYSADELASLPDGANMGLSCGNPVALASLFPGEVVVDLGSGGGFDVFIAGRNVGAEGRAIGVDMTPEMLAKARRNIAVYQEKTGLNNVEFRLGEIEHLPLPDNSVDVIISNCVINLSPDKPQVWREIARVLKPGGRVAVSDLALVRPLPDHIKGMVEALIGCVAGAVLISDTEKMARDAGLKDIVCESKNAYLDSLTEWNDPLYQKVLEQLPPGTRASDYITSLNISAQKPGKKGCCG
jgi:arsenite methyltransferase